MIRSPYSSWSDLSYSTLEHIIPVRIVELTSYHQQEESRKVKGERGCQSMCLTSLQNPPHWTPWFGQCTCHQDEPWVRMTRQENSETNPITINPKTASHMAVVLGSPLLSAWTPLPNKISCFVLYVSPQTLHFQVLDRAHSWALEGVSSLQQSVRKRKYSNSGIFSAFYLVTISKRSPERISRKGLEQWLLPFWRVINNFENLLKLKILF